MKKFSFLPLLFLSLIGFGQKQIVVQNGTAHSFENLTTAIDSANAGDTIYIPGGGFASPATIDKTLHWRGVGHYPDSTAATGFTNITNNVNFSGNCDNSTFEGICFTGSLVFGSTDNEATGIVMRRCRVIGNLSMRNNNGTSNGYPDLDFTLTECVTQGVYGNHGTNIKLEKNMIFGTTAYFYQCYFNHNYFCTNDYVVQYAFNCQYINNVFAQNQSIRYSENCNFQNNIFNGGMPYNPVTQTFTGSGNIHSVGATNIFTSITGNIYSFSYDNDYHLKLGTTGTAEDGTVGVSISGTATDGTNAGIYGTSLPYKEGAVPYAPHIQSATVDNQAVSGNLGVQITVAAQER